MTTALTPKQLNVLSHLLSGESINETASATGVHRSTIYLWRRQEAFRCYYDDARVNRALATADQTSAMSNTALHAIYGILCNAEASPAVRLRAATLVLQTALLPLKQSEIRQNSTKLDTEQTFPEVELAAPIQPAGQTDSAEPPIEPEQISPEIKEAIPPAARLSPRDLLRSVAARVEASTGFRLPI